MKKIYVEKKDGFNVEANKVKKDINEVLNIHTIENVRVLNKYILKNISEDTYEKSKYTIFSEAPVDYLYENNFPILDEAFVFEVEYLPGQYDQRKDFAQQCISLINNDGVEISTSKVYIIKGILNEIEKNKIKKYFINPVDSREVSNEKLKENNDKVREELIVENFIKLSENQLRNYYEDMAFAMKFEDLLFCQKYFKDEESRNPTIVELKVIDTYWSDHCRHTTFSTEIKEIYVEESPYKKIIEKSLKEYISIREKLNKKGDITLMDLAQINMGYLKHEGKLNDLEESSEINAASIEVDVKVEDSTEKWLVMFKNETHNHPTEIEPFGGASTCLGGAIRDPLSGRSYVYGAMRITGSADPRVSIDNTLSSKLPQIKITTEAADGYSSYGNQIGVPTGFVDEIYHDGFLAKRMEVGAVIGANKKEHVIRKEPICGDVVILIGGKTGRDGCGGATGSSKAHNNHSIEKSFAEVQKGNAPMERKIQRLFRNHKVSKLIKKCNDFGAGGISVAIGEISSSIDIYLDRIPKKYEGLNSLELAISESQERMAVVIDNKHINEFIEYATEENLDASVVADITDTGRLRMYNKDEKILDICREFLNTNGVTSKSDVVIEKNPVEEEKKYILNKKNILDKISDINISSKRGLIEKFDSTVGGNTVLMPLGGKYQLTPSEGMAFKIPVVDKEVYTATLMSYGYNPKICEKNPFLGGIYSVVEAVTRIVAMGGEYERIRLSLQEYFEKLENNPKKWGKPFAALLGAFKAQKELNIGSIGGKDSMSGTFNDIHVPPTLITFAVDNTLIDKIVSSEIKKSGSYLVELKSNRDNKNMIDFNSLKDNFEKINQLNKEDKILSMSSVKLGGSIISAIKMSLGNKIGINFYSDNISDGFKSNYGNIILEIDEIYDINEMFKDYNYKIIGKTLSKEIIKINKEEIDMNELIEKWEEPLENIFPAKSNKEDKVREIIYNKDNKRKSTIKIPRPKVIIPVFPGTNCEYESAHAFENCGAKVETFVFNNLSQENIKDSIKTLSNKIQESQIMFLPGGFSAGDEPDGSGKFISTVLRNDLISHSIMEMLKNKDGLILGVCNGFQALVKVGLLPYGEIRIINEDDVTLTYNNIGRHMSKIVNTKLVSNKSPWYNSHKLGDVFQGAISHGEGRFIGSNEIVENLIKNGQITTQYVDLSNNPTMNIDYNPNGSLYAVEGICSPDGRVLGKMAHTERMKKNTCINVSKNEIENIFKNGVNYFL